MRAVALAALLMTVSASAVEPDQTWSREEVEALVIRLQAVHEQKIAERDATIKHLYTITRRKDCV